MLHVHAMFRNSENFLFFCICECALTLPVRVWVPGSLVIFFFVCLSLSPVSTFWSTWDSVRTPSLPSALSRGIGTGKEGIIREGIIGKVYGHYQINVKNGKRETAKSMLCRYTPDLLHALKKPLWYHFDVNIFRALPIITCMYKCIYCSNVEGNIV